MPPKKEIKSIKKSSKKKEIKSINKSEIKSKSKISVPSSSTLSFKNCVPKVKNSPCDLTKW